MPIVQTATNLKVQQYLVDTEATDLLDGVAVSYGSLVALPGFPSPTSRGFIGTPTAGYRSYAPGTLFIARDTGRVWMVDLDSGLAKVLLLITQGSASASVGAELVYVVSESTTYLGTFPNVFSTIQAAITQGVADRTTRNVPFAVLVFPGSYAGFTLEPNTHVAAVTEGRSDSTLVNSVVTYNTDGLACNASLRGLGFTAAAQINLDATLAADFTTRVTECSFSTSGAINCDLVDGDSFFFENCSFSNLTNQNFDAVVPAFFVDCSFDSTNGAGVVGDFARCSFGGCRFFGRITVTNAPCVLDGCVLRTDGTIACLRVVGTANASCEGSSFDSGAATDTVDGTGTLTLLGGATGIRSVAVAVTISVTQPIGEARILQNVAGTATISDSTTMAVVSVAAGTFTITLPTAARMLPGHEIVVRRLDSSAGAVTVSAVAGEVIDTTLTFILNPAGFARLHADRAGARWLRIP